MATAKSSDELKAAYARREADIFVHLTQRNMKALKRHFDSKVRGKGITLSDFTFVMLQCLGPFVTNEIEFVSHVIELFNQVDVNGDRAMEWDELTSYVVEAGMAATGDSELEAQSKYYYEPFETKTTNQELHSDIVFASRMKVWGGADLVLAYEAHSQMLRLYEPSCSPAAGTLVPLRHCRHDTAFSPHTVLAAVYVPELHRLGSSSRETTDAPCLSFWDAETSNLLHRMPTKWPIEMLVYAKSAFLLLGCGAPSGAGTATPIQAWDPKTFELKLTLPVMSTIVTCMAEIPGTVCKYLIAAGKDGNLWLWDLKRNKLVRDRTLFAHENGVKLVEYNESLQVAVSTGLPPAMQGQSSAHQLPNTTYALHVWDVYKWLDDLYQAEVAASAARRAKLQAGARRAAAMALLGGGLAAIAKAANTASSGPEAPSDVVELPSLPLSRPGSVAEEDHDSDEMDTPRMLHQFTTALRPAVLLGHSHEVIAIQIQHDAPIAHVVSGDVSGELRVWSLLTHTCIQVIQMTRNVPRHVPVSALLQELDNLKGADDNESKGDDDDVKSAHEASSVLSPSLPVRKRRLSVSDYAAALVRQQNLAAAAEDHLRHGFLETEGSAQADREASIQRLSPTKQKIADDAVLNRNADLRCLNAVVVMPKSATTCGGPSLIAAGNRFRFFRMVQERPQALPLVACLYASATIRFITVTTRAITVWDGLAGRVHKVFKASRICGGADISAACLDGRGRKIVVGDSAGHIRVLNLKNGSVMKELDPHTKQITALLYCESEKAVISVGGDGQVHVCNEKSLTGFRPNVGVGRPYMSTLVRRFGVPNPTGESSSAVSGSGSRKSALDIHAGTVYISAVAYSEHLNLIATVSRREVAGPGKGGNCLLLWTYDKVNPLGACATPGFVRGLEEVNDMVFLDPYPALLVVDVQGHFLVWAVHPSPCAGTLRAVWSTPGSVPCQSLHVANLASTPPMRGVWSSHTDSSPSRFAPTFGVDPASSPEGSEPRATLPPSSSSEVKSPRSAPHALDGRSGFAIFAGCEDGVIHRWDLPGSMLAHIGLEEVAAQPVDTLVRRLPTSRLSIDQVHRFEEITLGLAVKFSHLPLGSELIPGDTKNQGKAVEWCGAWRAHTSSVTWLQWISENSTLLSGSTDGLARLWDVEGRMLGGLDPNPRFHPPAPRWQVPVYAEGPASPSPTKAVTGADDEEGNKEPPPVSRWATDHIANTRVFKRKSAFSSSVTGVKGGDKGRRARRELKQGFAGALSGPGASSAGAGAGAGADSADDAADDSGGFYLTQMDVTEGLRSPRDDSLLSSRSSVGSSWEDAEESDAAHGDSFTGDGRLQSMPGAGRPSVVPATSSVDALVSVDELLSPKKSPVKGVRQQLDEMPGYTGLTCGGGVRVLFLEDRKNALAHDPPSPSAAAAPNPLDTPGVKFVGFAPPQRRIVWHWELDLQQRLQQNYAEAEEVIRMAKILRVASTWRDKVARRLRGSDDLRSTASSVGSTPRSSLQSTPRSNSDRRDSVSATLLVDEATELAGMKSGDNDPLGPLIRHQRARRKPRGAANSISSTPAGSESGLSYVSKGRRRRDSQASLLDVKPPIPPRTPTKPLSSASPDVTPKPSVTSSAMQRSSTSPPMPASSSPSPLGRAGRGGFSQARHHGKSQQAPKPLSDARRQLESIERLVRRASHDSQMTDDSFFDPMYIPASLRAKARELTTSKALVPDNVKQVYNQPAYVSSYKNMASYRSLLPAGVLPQLSSKHQGPIRRKDPSAGARNPPAIGGRTPTSPLRAQTQPSGSAGLAAEPEAGPALPGRHMRPGRKPNASSTPCSIEATEKERRAALRRSVLRGSLSRRTRNRVPKSGSSRPDDTHFYGSDDDDDSNDGSDLGMVAEAARRAAEASGRRRHATSSLAAGRMTASAPLLVTLAGRAPVDSMASSSGPIRKPKKDWATMSQRHLEELLRD